MLDPRNLADVTFDPSVLERMRRNRQLRMLQCEAGGQLFGTADGNAWHVRVATGPRKDDVRTLFGYEPSRVSEQKEIDHQYKRGLHYLGDWHTHREFKATPSPRDIDSMRSMISQSGTDLPCFLMIIVGKEPDLSSWHVSRHAKYDWSRLLATS